jgi:hypothetical protein
VRTARGDLTMKKFILVCVLLTGCASASIPAAVRVEVPVPVPCVMVMPAPPTFAVDALPIGADIWDQMAALRADRIQRQAYEKILEVAIQACQ